MPRPTVEYNSTKDKKNQQKHGISLARVAEFDWATAVFDVDNATDYGELREIAKGFIGGTLYLLVFVQLTPTHVRAISLRPTNRTEDKTYAEDETKPGRS